MQLYLSKSHESVLDQPNVGNHTKVREKYSGFCTHAHLPQPHSDSHADSRISNYSGTTLTSQKTCPARPFLTLRQIQISSARLDSAAAGQPYRRPLSYHRREWLSPDTRSMTAGKIRRGWFFATQVDGNLFRHIPQRAVFVLAPGNRRQTAVRLASPKSTPNDRSGTTPVLSMQIHYTQWNAGQGFKRFLTYETTVLQNRYLLGSL